MPQPVRTSSFRDLEAIARAVDAGRGPARLLGKPVGALLEGLVPVDLPLLVVIEVLRHRWPRLTIEKLIRNRDVHAYLAETVEASRVARLVERVAHVVATRTETIARPAPEGPPKQLHGLGDWAEQQGVGWALHGRVARLLRDPASMRAIYMLRVHISDLTIAQVIEQAREPEKILFEAQLAGALGRHLQSLAELGRAGAAEEARAVAAPVPKDPILAEWVTLLAPRRAAVRALVAPRPRNQAMRVDLTFDEQRQLRAYVIDPLTGSLHVSLHVGQAVGAGETCQCTPRVPACCDHVLAVYDRLLGEIGRGVNTALVERAREALVPPWKRTLDALALLGTARPTSIERLGFLIKTRPGLHVKALADPSGARGRQISVAEALPAARDEREREALEILARLPEARAVERSQVDELLRALGLLRGHPLLFVQDGNRRVPLRLERGPLVIAARPGDDGSYRVVLEIEGVDAPAHAGAAALGAGGERLGLWLDDDAGHAAVVDIDRRVRDAWQVLERHERALPAEAGAALGEQLVRLSATLPVRAHGTLLGEQVAAEPRFILRLCPEGEVGLCAEALVRVHAESDPLPIGEGPAQVGALRANRRVWAQRDLAAELATVHDVLRVLPLPTPGPGEPFRWQLEGEEALDLLAVLPALVEPWTVEWPKSPPRSVGFAAAGSLRLNVQDRRDWFGLDGTIEVDGEKLALAELLSALRERQRFVKLGAHRWVRLADDLRARLERVADVVYRGKHGLEISPLAAPLLADAVDELHAPRRWAELLTRRRAADTAAAPRLPRLTAELRDYQVQGFEWLARLAEWAPGACLADDMGLGKTIQAIALLVHRQAKGAALVVAPTSVCFNWVRELARFAPELRAHMYSDHGAVPAGLAAGDVLIVSYGLMARDIDDLAAIDFGTLVLDEAHAIKNPQSQRARAALQLRAGFTLALTGTPIENRLAELWSLYRLIAPGLLGSWERFRERFAAPIERSGDPERRAALVRLTQPFLLRRLKTQVARELPTRSEVRVDVELSAEERKLYEAERLAAAAALAKIDVGRGRGGQDGRFQVLAAITRLRQLCCHAKLCEPRTTVPSSKLARLVEIVEELRDEGHRTLIFSQFTSLLALAREALDDAGVSSLYLDGSTPERERRTLVDTFQAGGHDAFLISLKAGGTGLNLTAADNVVHLDPWWNPAVEDQASDRAHRLGQTRPVTIYKLVAMGTIEEKILAMQADKRALVAGILDGASTPSTLSTQELLALLADDGAGARPRKRGDASKPT